VFSLIVLLKRRKSIRLQQARASHIAEPTKRIIRIHSTFHLAPGILPRHDWTKCQIRELVREVFCKLGIRDQRLDGSFNFALRQFHPVDLTEEAMLFDRKQIFRHVRTEAFARLLSKETGEQVLCVWAEEVWHCELLLHDFLEDFGMIAAWEGRCTSKKIEAESAEGPPVDCKAVLLALNHFRGHVFDCAENGLAGVVVVNGDFAEAEIGQE